MSVQGVTLTVGYVFTGAITSGAFAGITDAARGQGVVSQGRGDNKCSIEEQCCCKNKLGNHTEMRDLFKSGFLVVMSAEFEIRLTANITIKLHIRPFISIPNNNPYSVQYTEAVIYTWRRINFKELTVSIPARRPAETFSCGSLTTGAG